MKRNLIFCLLATMLVTVPAFAKVSVEEQTDVDYLYRSGYSQATAEQVFIEKNRVTAEDVEPLYQRDANIFVRGWKALWSYVDPSHEQFDKLHHDIAPSSSWTDL